MTDVPCLRRHVRLHVLSDDEIAVYDERGLRTIRGRLLPLLVPHLDGRRSVADLAALLEGTATLVDVDYGLSLLEEAGCLRGAGAGPDDELTGLVDAMLASPDASRRWRERERVCVRASGHLDTSPFVTALAQLGIGTAGDGQLTVAVAEDYLDPALASLNDAARAHQRPWLLVKPVGRVVWVGPLLTPPVGPCWACLASRLAEQREVRHWSAGGGARVPSLPQPSAIASVSIAAHAAAIQVLAFSAGAAVSSSGAVLTIDAVTLETTRHEVARLPYCECCGRGPRARRARRRPALVSRPRTPGAGPHGTSPADALRAVERHVSPITGIVSRLDSSTPVASDAIHACVSDYVFPASARRDIASIAPRPHRRSAGRGQTAVDARASAVFEALERYSCVFRGDEPRSRATLASLGRSAVRPQECLNVSAAQYRNRDRANAEGHAFTWIPEPFCADRAIEWTPAWSLTHRVWRDVPAAYCYFGYDGPGHHEFCRADSNGVASGSSLEDAILHAFLELAERDAVGIWWFNRIRRPRIDLATVPDPYVAEVQRVYAGLDRDIRVFDITTDLGVPACAAVSGGAGPSDDELIFGFGADLDPVRAVTRALGEMNQFLPEVVAGSLRQRLSCPLDDAGFLAPAARPRAVSLRGVRRWPAIDALADVRECVTRASRCGLDVLVVDQTRPEIGVPVARVIVPGLRHFWPRFGRGRLYSVPVRMRWRTRPLCEDQLTRAALLV